MLDNEISELFIKPVAHFRTITGLPMYSYQSPQLGAISHPLHLSLLVEEFEELAGAQTLADEADALADIVVIASGYYLDAGPHTTIDAIKMIRHTYKIATHRGINLVGAFNLVHESNMSKVCDYATAIATQAMFAREHQLATYVKEVAAGEWAVYSGQDDKVYPRGKLLKPLSYFKPRWEGTESVWVVEPNPYTPEQLETALAGVTAARAAMGEIL
jgi:hypothetical protein